MSSSTGGRADKLGNRYEGLWVAYNLIRLLAEEVGAVQLEALGDDERGVDLWVTQKDGTRHAQQCKRKNRAVGKWSVGELARQGVLTYLAEQLRRSPTALFTFVSSHAAAELRELCDAARSAGGDPEAYFRATLAVKAHADNLRKLCGAVGVNSQDAAGRSQAFDLLCRTYTHSFEDSPEGRAMVCSLARCHVAGNPETAVEVLATFAQDRMGSLITTEMVRQHLRDRDFGLTNIAGMPTASARIERLREEFLESLRPGLINAALVPRPETKQLIDLINRPDDNRLIIVHGRAGSGKSFVLLQLVEGLARAGVPYLPLRFDRRPPRISAQRYGVDVCDLPESPAVVLKSLYGGRPAVLVIDQLDAVRWTTSHASAQWEACQEVIDEALGFPGLVVIVACRSFDLKDDQQISGWQSRRKGRLIEIGDLPPTTVAEVVRAAGGAPEQLTERQRTLLRSPLHLALWVQVHAVGKPQPVWNTHADLMRAFWKSRFEALAALGVPPDESRGAVEALTADMDSRGELASPARILDGYPRAAAALKSLHIVVESDRRVTFAHQAYFEYQVAVRLLNQVTTGPQAVAAWVQGGDQTLLRREQLRLVLTLLRDERPDEYGRTLRQIVNAPRGSIRFHLKQLALRLLGEFQEPSSAERDLVLELARSSEWRDHVFAQVFRRQPVWFETLDALGLVASWLSGQDERLVAMAVHLCHWWSGRCGDRVAALLAPYVRRPDPWPRRIAAVLPFDPVDDSPELFSLRLSLVRAGCYRHLSISEKLAASQPGWCVDLVEAFFDLRHRIPEPPESTPGYPQDLPYLVGLHEAQYLEGVAAAVPECVWSRLVPRIVHVCESTLVEADPPDDSPFADDRTWPEDHRGNEHNGSVELPRIVARAGSVLAARDSESFRRDYRHVLNHRARTIQYMVGLALADADSSTADLAIGWLCDVACRLSLCDERGQRWGIARRIIRRHAPACSDDAYRRLEAMILAYHEPDERRSIEWKAQCSREGWPIGPNRYGLAQHALLSCLPADRLSGRARSEVGVLERKFGQPAGEFYRNATGRIRSLVGPIPADRVSRIGDAGWLQIVRSAARPRGPWVHRNVGDSYFTEPTAESYARQLGDEARRQPQRYARLALSIPSDADPQYLSAILYAMADPSPPTQDAADWSPASDDQVTAVIEHVGYRAEGEIGRALCWLMGRHRQALSGSPCMEVLCRYATEHPHPSPDDRVVWKGEGEIDYDGAAINCTRGIALGVMAQLLFERPSLFESFQLAIRQAVADPSTIVRVAAAGACLPILNTDRESAVELFLYAVSDQNQILATHNVIEFIRYALWSHFPRLEPLLTNMGSSARPAVAAAGAAWTTVAWLGDLAPRSAVDAYLRGSKAQRLGVARAAAHNCEDARVADRCGALLLELIDDPDGEVQGVVAEFLRRDAVLRTPVMRDVAVRFIAGPGFAAHPTWLVWALRRHPDSLLPLAPIVSAVCRRLATDLSAGSDRGGRDSAELDRFVPLLLRLYEQAEQARDLHLRGECLDWWDRLLEAQVGGAVESLTQLDHGTVSDL